jgi:hypothetical protein
MMTGKKLFVITCTVALMLFISLVKVEAESRLVIEICLEQIEMI